MNFNSSTKKKIFVWVSVIALFFAAMAIPINVYAAELGTTVDNPVNIIFDQDYTKSWNKNNDHLYCYNKLTLNEQGIVNMSFSKPTDSEGEYGRLTIKFYDSMDNLVWDTDCYDSIESASSNYKFSVGLAEGTYYVLVKPRYIVTSGSVKTNYKFSFAPTEYCEIEPNESAGKATLMKSNGMFYQGFFGEGDDVEREDYYKFQLSEGVTYRLRMDNYSAVNASTILMNIYGPDGDYDFCSFNKVDEDGYDYCEYTASETGIHYLRIYNYGRKQIPYKVSIGVQSCANHSYGEGVVTKEATFSECGTVEYTCTVCGAVRIEQIDKLSFGWSKVGDKSYWYENAVKQGTYDDAHGVIGDGTVRGREIYDPDSDGWYWLDACYDGAKACSKEVWMPYIYQDEKNWSEDEIKNNSYASGDMAEQVVKAIHEGTGKWVRYDANGKMYKGWYTVWEDEQDIYPTQYGNTYYYDPQTGLMAKGYVTIDGVKYHFNEVTGVLDL